MSQFLGGFPTYSLNTILVKLDESRYKVYRLSHFRKVNTYKNTDEEISYLQSLFSLNKSFYSPVIL